MQEGDFLEGGSDPFVDLINQLEFLELGADYVNDIDRLVDVTLDVTQDRCCSCSRRRSLVAHLESGRATRLARTFVQ